MRGSIWLACLLMLATGCGKSKTDTKLAGGGGDTRPALTKESSTVDIAKDLLRDSGYEQVSVVSKEEKPTTLFKKPAVALHLQWTTKGESKNSLFIIQSQKVECFEDYDTAKSLEENIATAVQIKEKK